MQLHLETLIACTTFFYTYPVALPTPRKQNAMCETCDVPHKFQQNKKTDIVPVGNVRGTGWAGVINMNNPLQNISHQSDPR